VSELRRMSGDLYWALHTFHSRGLAEFTRIISRSAFGKIEEVVASDGTTVFRKPSSLISFCRHEILQLARSGAEVRSCEYCQHLYVGGRKAGQRAGEQTPRFCSNRCRGAKNRQDKKLEGAGGSTGVKVSAVPK
jgi:hypothetical protein